MTGGTSVRRVEVPATSLIADWYPGAYLLDSYAVDIPSTGTESMRALATRALGQPPRWFRMLIAIRDTSVRPFGLKTSMQLRRTELGGSQIDFFPILQEQADEIILGEDDMHLDFRLSVLRLHRPGSSHIIATTVVRVHGRLGMAYIALIRPFHHLVVQQSMRRLARRTA